MTLALAMRTSRMGNVLRLAVLALPLCLPAVPSPAQTAPPAAPSFLRLVDGRDAATGKAKQAVSA